MTELRKGGCNFIGVRDGTSFTGGRGDRNRRETGHEIIKGGGDPKRWTEDNEGRGEGKSGDVRPKTGL